MIRLFAAGLESWGADDRVKAVFVHGAGDRAFCAGGDVKSTYHTGMSYRRGDTDERVIALFFGEEYRLNRQLFHFEKPLFAFMNGITMGGGFGIAGPCKYRIASEKTVFAMPEVGIGFFPDVGSTYFLNRAPGEMGTWLTLTGKNIGAGDMLHCGLATHYVPTDQQETLIEKLSECASDEEIGSVLSEFSASPEGGAELQENADIIDECFAGNDVRDVIENLRKHDSLWARQQAEIIESRSPMSLKVSLAHLRMTKNMSFDEVTAQDFTLAQHFMKGHDFYEGVRAVLVDKDNQPVWEPTGLEDVTLDMVQDYFRPIGVALDEIAA